MAVISGALKAVTVGVAALLLASLALVVGEVFEESGIAPRRATPSPTAGSVAGTP